MASPRKTRALPFLIPALLALCALPARAEEGGGDAAPPFAAHGGKSLPGPAALVEPAEIEPGSEPAPWFPERLVYKVRWGFAPVGTATLVSTEAVLMNGKLALHVVSEANTAGWIDSFYKVRDRNESWIDLATGSSLGYLKKIREGSFYRDEWVLYDHSVGRFLGKKWKKDGGEPEVRVGPVGFPIQDVLSAIYWVRGLDLEVGRTYELDVNTTKTWPLKVVVHERKTYWFPSGRCDCYLVEPFLREEGIFIQKGKSMKVWLRAEEPHEPVRMSAEVIIGSVTAELIEEK